MEDDQAPKKNVLVVEDDPVTAFLTEKVLENRFIVDTVANGHDALAAIEKKQYAIVLMDINLGDINMDGIRTMRLMRYSVKGRRLKIVAVTAISDAKEWYKEQGFNDLIMKPIGLEHVLYFVNG